MKPGGVASLPLSVRCCGIQEFLTYIILLNHRQNGVHPKMGVSFWLPLGSYTGMLSPLLWTTPNLGCTLKTTENGYTCYFCWEAGDLVYCT